MPMQKIEFEFPDEKEGESTEIEIEGSSMESPFEEKPDSDKEKTPPESKTKGKVTDNELDIEIVNDTPKRDRNRKVTPPPDELTEEELEEYSEKVQKRMKKFSKGFHDERRAKEAAQRERDELERLTRQMMEENQKLKEKQSLSHRAMYEQAKQTIEKDLKEAKREYTAAHQAGDSEALVEAQEKLNRAQFREEQMKTVRPPAGQDESDTVQQTSQTPESGQSTPPTTQRRQPDERARQWANENTWFGQDQEMTALALGTHAKLVDSGIDPTSDEYYEKLNSRMHQVFPEEFGDTKPPEGEPKTRSHVVAPATRSTAPKKVKLTQTQVQLAKRLGIPLEEYAKQQAALMRKENG